MVVLVYKASPVNAIRYLFLALLQSIFAALVLFVLKQIIDAISFPATHTLSEVYLFLGLFFLVQLGTVFAAQLSAHVSFMHQQKLQDSLSTLVMNKAISVEYAYYENPVYHDTLHVAQQQALYRSSQLLAGLTGLLMQGATVAMVGFLLAFYYWQFALLAVVIAIPLFLVKWFFARAGFLEEKRLAPQERESNYLQQILTGMAFAKEVRLFGFGERFIHRYKQLRSLVFQHKHTIQRKQNNYSLLIEAVEILLVGFVFVMLAADAWQQLITPGIFVLYLQGFHRFQSSFKGLLQSFVQLLQQRLFVNHLFSFLALPEPRSSTGILFPTHPEKLEVRELSFTYPGTEKLVLDEVSFTCSKGEIIAIVGENGSGKSTMVNILGQLYSRYGGEVYVDGKPYRSFSTQDFRIKSSFLFQDFEKYFLRIDQNITLGSEGMLDTDQLQQAMFLSKSADFIGQLPKGIETQLGRSFHAGEQLSGGQWQKLALARLFYKNAGLVVMDEPTSALDALAENELYRALRHWGTDKIIIMVTHRLAQLKQADRIVVLRNGSIVEQGNFVQLMTENGYFAQLFGAQV